MQLTRREFAAALSGGLSLFSFGANPVPPADVIRHAHLELPAGQYTREALSMLIARAAEVAGLPAPEAISALGAEPDAAAFPESFVVTVQFPGRVLVVRASRQHQGVPELTVRSQRKAVEFRYSAKDAAFHRA